MKHFKRLSSYLDYVQLPRPEHPMLSVLSAKGEKRLPCPRESSPPITNDCYNISLKKIIKGDFQYGRTKYDFTNGVMIFLAPRQVMQWESGLVVEQKGFSITFHEDFLKGTGLEYEIKKYGFFSYSANEALHLSPKEEGQIESIFENIEIEYYNNQDKFSKDIIITQLATLLKYANRFYERQFLHRKDMSSSLLEKLNHYLITYTEVGKLQESGVPSVKSIAFHLSVSQRYLSDVLKKETGRSATEHIHLFLINEAKSRLLEPSKNIADVAYDLGFEYPQYFSRLFKKKVGISPSEFRDKFSAN